MDLFLMIFLRISSSLFFHRFQEYFWVLFRRGHRWQPYAHLPFRPDYQGRDSSSSPYPSFLGSRNVIFRYKVSLFPFYDSTLYSHYCNFLAHPFLPFSRFFPCPFSIIDGGSRPLSRYLWYGRWCGWLIEVNCCFYTEDEGRGWWLEACELIILRVNPSSGSFHPPTM